MHKFILLIYVTVIFAVNLNGQSTNWTESNLKEHWAEKGFSAFEGIYEDVSYPYYKLGLIKESDNYSLVFIGIGTTDSDYKKWLEGDLKAILKPTATSGLFKSTWYLASKETTQRYVIQFDKGVMNLLTTSLAGNEIYLKIYPPDNDEEKNDSQFKQSSGTGFGISQNGIIVTNFHVIDGAETINVRGVNSDFNTIFKAKVILADKNNDLALIQVEGLGFSSFDTIPYTIKTSLAGVGENIFVLGYPLRATMGDEIKLTNGIISSRTGFQGDITSYQISAPVQPGNSGGPLFDNQGNLIGIINAKHIGAENASYAVKASYLTNLIELLPNPPKMQMANSLTGKTLTQQVELAKKYIYIIETK